MISSGGSGVGPMSGGGAESSLDLSALSDLESLSDEVLVSNLFPKFDITYLMQLRQVSRRFRLLIDENLLAELNPWYHLPANVNYKVKPSPTCLMHLPSDYGMLSHLSELKTGEVVIYICFSDQRAVCDMNAGTHVWERDTIARDFVSIHPFGRFYIKSVNHSYMLSSAAAADSDAFSSGNWAELIDREGKNPVRTIRLKGHYKSECMLHSGTHLAIGYDASTIDIIDCITTTVLYTIYNKYTCLLPLYGGRLGVGCEDGSIRIFNAGKLENQWQAHSGPVSALQILSDGKLASASQHGSQIALAAWEFVYRWGRFYDSREAFLKDSRIRTAGCPQTHPDPRDAGL